jgi:hypothetical protein
LYLPVLQCFTVRFSHHPLVSVWLWAFLWYGCNSPSRKGTGICTLFLASFQYFYSLRMCFPAFSIFDEEGIYFLVNTSYIIMKIETNQALWRQISNSKGFRIKPWAWWPISGRSPNTLQTFFFLTEGQLFLLRIWFRKSFPLWSGFKMDLLMSTWIRM